MKISVIVPIYNAEKCIRRCIDSIIGQTVPAYEIICVNDGSTDSTATILDEYVAINNVKVLTKTNGGEGSARNYGLDHISDDADFVAFVDSDDWVRPTWLQDYIENWDGEDVLFQNALWLKGKKVYLERNVCISKGCSLIDKMHQMFLRNTIGYVWAGIWRASIIRDNNIRFKKFRMWEDAVFSAEFMCYVKNINIIDRKLCHDYGYVYQYPTSFRSYTVPSALLIEGYVERFNILYRLYTGLNSKTLFKEVNNHISQAIVAVFIKADSQHLTKSERIAMIGEARRTIVPMEVSSPVSLKSRMVCYILCHSLYPDLWLSVIKRIRNIYI